MSFYNMFQKGMRQHYDLGSFLRNRYKGFLNESYDRHEVGVTDVCYCLGLRATLAVLALIRAQSDTEIPANYVLLLAADFSSKYRL